jgi:hypothetical protein
MARALAVVPTARPEVPANLARVVVGPMAAVSTARHRAVVAIGDQTATVRRVTITPKIRLLD